MIPDHMFDIKGREDVCGVAGGEQEFLFSCY